jgi:hypothetical protein
MQLFVDEVADVTQPGQYVLAWGIGAADEHVAGFWHQFAIRWPTPYF